MRGRAVAPLLVLVSCAFACGGGSGEPSSPPVDTTLVVLLQGAVDVRGASLDLRHDGAFTVTHANNAQADRTFMYVALG